jgi:purine-binding chemotaxis protein CheW
MSNLHVICKIAGTEYAIPADDVFQMESFTGATPIPGAAPHIAGLVQVRQQIIGVFNMRVKMGLPAIAPTLESRVIVLKLKERLIGFLVDSAREVQTILPEQFIVPPEVVTQQSEGFVKSIVQIKDRMIMLLDAAKVIGEENAHV